jgi:hypothetical protein
MIEYLLGLAQEGETLLFTYQKPVIVDGEQQYHADGSPKYTYPAFRPGSKPLKGATYVNTGIFIEDRLKKNFSAGKDNIEHVAFLPLDDIGTKSKTPDLQPTWKMETSPGNYQWGYVFREQPTKAAYCAAINAIAAAGYTDPGATNPVRNIRLPGSVNLKPGRDAFEAKLVEFHEGREFTLEEICAALEVTPLEESAAAPSIRVKDTGNDSVLRWLSDNGHVLEPANSSGWVGVVCPNAEQHTDGSLGGRYLPATRAYCCYHGHCEHLDSRAFLQWVCDNGGPQAEHGLRDDLTAGVMSEALSKIKPNEAFTDKAREEIERVNREEAARVDRTQWFNRFAYVMSDDGYFDLTTRQEISRPVFNAIYRHQYCQSRHSGRKVEAATWYDEQRQDCGGRALTGITYAPGETEIVTRDGLVYGNKWINARPFRPVEGRDTAAWMEAHRGDVARWLDHAAALIPDDDERRHVLDVMAFKVQNPNVKINHAVLHGGDEGCGKDTLWAPFIWAVCGPFLKNRGIIDSDGLAGQWGYALESEILILNELREPEAKERRALANRLKPIIAAPPETLTVNRKGLHPYEALNRVFVLAFTNDPVPITLPSQDRRWFCTWSRAPRMAPQEADALWNWYRSGGYEAIASWLLARDVSAFNPAATPIETDFKRSMIENGMSNAESFIMGRIQAREAPFSRGVVGAPFYAVCNDVSAYAPGGLKIVQPALLHALKEAGWQDMGRIASARHATKKACWAAPWLLAAGATKSQLRDLLEDVPGAPPVSVVNLDRLSGRG